MVAPSDAFRPLADLEAATAADVVEHMGYLGPDEFARYIKSEIPKWTAVVKASGAKLE